MKRPLRATLLICTLIIGGACYRQVERAVTPDEAISAARAHSVRGFVLRDGSVVDVIDSDLLLVVGDTLIVREPAATPRGRRSAERPTQAIRIEDIRMVQVDQIDRGKTVAAVILVPVGVLGLLAVAVLASSCPFIYAYDGTNFIPAAEPLAGAVSEGLSRTDLSELEGLVAEDGIYRVIIANEIDETQYVDAFQLVAIDHPVGTRAVVDRAGVARLVPAARPPVRARDQGANDLLPLLQHNDEVWWPGNGGGPVFDAARGRDTLTFTFARPAASDSATLLVHTRNDVWGAYMLKRMLQLWGGQVDEWYRMLDGSAALRATNEEWVLREETWVLKLWVREDSGWVSQEVVMGGGPYISELQSVPVDLKRVSGDEVHIRVHPPQGYWRIDHVAMAGASAAAEISHVLHPVQPALLNGSDVRDLLSENDGKYMVMPSVGDRVELRFAAPPPPPDGFTRTVFARTSGWYRVHTDRTGPRHAAQLDSIWLTPGFPVEFARREYGAWRAQHPKAPLYPAGGVAVPLQR
jgi:hypothetical protein